MASLRQEDFTESIAGLAAGISSGDRFPLMLYRVYVSDGHEELVRGERMNGVNLRLMRNIAGIGTISPFSTICKMQLRDLRAPRLVRSEVRKAACRVRWWPLHCSSKKWRCAGPAEAASARRWFLLRRFSNFTVSEFIVPSSRDVFTVGL